MPRFLAPPVGAIVLLAIAASPAAAALSVTFVPGQPTWANLSQLRVSGSASQRGSVIVYVIRGVTTCPDENEIDPLAERSKRTGEMASPIAEDVRAGSFSYTSRRSGGWRPDFLTTYTACAYLYTGRTVDEEVLEAVASRTTNLPFAVPRAGVGDLPGGIAHIQIDKYRTPRSISVRSGCASGARRFRRWRVGSVPVRADGTFSYRGTALLDNSSRYDAPVPAPWPGTPRTGRVSIQGRYIFPSARSSRMGIEMTTRILSPASGCGALRSRRVTRAGH